MNIKPLILKSFFLSMLLITGCDHSFLEIEADFNSEQKESQTNENELNHTMKRWSEKPLASSSEYVELNTEDSNLSVNEGEYVIIKFDLNDGVSTKSGWWDIRILDESGNDVTGGNSDFVGISNRKEFYSFDGVKWGGSEYEDHIFYATFKIISGNSRDYFFVKVKTIRDYQTEGTETYTLRITEKNIHANKFEFTQSSPSNAIEVPFEIKENDLEYVDLDTVSSKLEVEEGDYAFYLLGGDHLARDVFSRVMNGASIIIVIAPLATLFAFMVGITLGLPAGYFGGKLDTLLSFLANLILAFPVILLFYLLVTPEIRMTGLPQYMAIFLFSFPILFFAVLINKLQAFHYQYSH